MITLKNDNLSISINPLGAELSSLIYNNKEYIWQGANDIWNGHSPLLFPVIGRLKNSEYFYNGEKYNLEKHGFARNTMFTVSNHTDDECEFTIVYNDDTLKKYPFKFKLTVIYKLNHNGCNISYKVYNLSNEIMYFSLGAHPAFNTSNYSDCFISFESKETLERYPLVDGLIGEKYPFIKDSDKLLLDKHIFDNDAVIFSDLKSNTVSLTDTNSKDCVTLNISDFKYIGFWSKPGCEKYVCIEPWLGIDDFVSSNQKLEDKAGIISLSADSEYSCELNISISKI